MLKRKIEKEFDRFLKGPKMEALLVTGARQVGKTFSIRQFGKRSFRDFVEINFIERPDAKALFDGIRGKVDFFTRFSAFVGRELPEGETLVFFDEVQECPELVTFIKFLGDDARYRYVLSGSLIGVELRDIRSVPVGYLREVDMFPLDFEEFVRANGLPDSVIEHIRKSCENPQGMDSVIDGKMMELLRLYLVVGGMPAAVQVYLDTNDIPAVIREQQAILVQYRKDAAKYDERDKTEIVRTMELIPSELNGQNKRFYVNALRPGERFERANDNFVWLEKAGIALPVYNVESPRLPIELAKKANLFKLFFNDVGLLACLYMDGIQFRILNGEIDVNFGAVYENFVAQELRAHGFGKLYYFNSKKHGEVDFLIEHDGAVLPIEAKSGRDYDLHAALDNMLAEPQFRLGKAYVLNGQCACSVSDKITYLPIYALMFLMRNPLPERMIYKVDLSTLNPRV